MYKYEAIAKKKCLKQGSDHFEQTFQPKLEGLALNTVITNYASLCGTLLLTCESLIGDQRWVMISASCYLYVVVLLLQLPEFISAMNASSKGPLSSIDVCVEKEEKLT